MMPDATRHTPHAASGTRFKPSRIAHTAAARPDAHGYAATDGSTLAAYCKYPAIARFMHYRPPARSQRRTGNWWYGLHGTCCRDDA